MEPVPAFVEAPWPVPVVLLAELLVERVARLRAGAGSARTSMAWSLKTRSTFFWVAAEVTSAASRADLTCSAST